MIDYEYLKNQKVNRPEIGIFEYYRSQFKIESYYVFAEHARTIMRCIRVSSTLWQRE